MQHDDRVTIGQDPEAREEVRIRDTDRQRGLYILGINGTGKTTFLSHLIDQDIAKGYGLFFLDPHGDAINAILASGGRHPRLERDLILLNPTLEQQSFGINLLSCADIASMKAREDTYNRTYRVFERIFGDEWGEHGAWGLWLQQVLQYTLEAFVENQGYTLADIPFFLTNQAFRNHLINNMRYNRQAIDFWHNEFSAEPPHIQRERTQPLRTRMSIFLRPHVRDIVGQVANTIDFGECMRRNAIVLVALPNILSLDTKRILGKIILSDLLHAVQARQELTERPPFSIYVDEVQHFANSDDFAILFTEARKYGIATAIAHQERFGQLADNKKMAGATLQAANLICFQLSPLDVPELGSVFAEAPPTEVRREQELAISQNPVSDLLRGHTNPAINAFVQKHLLRLVHQREDIREAMEAERLIRLDLLDEASLGRLEAQQAGLLGRGSSIDMQSYLALSRAEEALLSARKQTAQLAALHERAQSLRYALRMYTSFLTAVMEGRMAPGSDAFSTFLIDRVTASRPLPEPLIRCLTLYISLEYGDPGTPRAVPFALARTHNLSPRLVTALFDSASEKAQLEKAAFLAEHEGRFEQDATQTKTEYLAVQLSFAKLVKDDIDTWLLNGGALFNPGALFRAFALYQEYPYIQTLLQPYHSSRLTQPWNALFPDPDNVSGWLRADIRRQRDKALTALAYFHRYNPTPGSVDALLSRLGFLGRIRYPANAHFIYELSFLDALVAFINRHGESAIVMLVLLVTATEEPHWKLHTTSGYVNRGDLRLKFIERLAIHAEGYEYYPRYNMLCLPSVEGVEQITVLRLLNDIAVFLQTRNLVDDLSQYMWHCQETFDTEERGYEPRERFRIRLQDGLNGKYFLEALGTINGADARFHCSVAYGMQLLDKAARSAWSNSHFAHIWTECCDDFMRTYLKARAWDLAYYGEQVADKTFPQPRVEGTNAEQVADIVAVLTRVMRRHIQNTLVAKINWRREENERRVQEKYEERFRNQVVPVPDFLDARILSKDDAEMVKQACIRELVSSGRDDARAALAVVTEFAGFCRLLREPANLIWVPTGQYIEKRVNTRTERDMADEMSRKLRDLEPHTAYARVLVEREGRTTVIKRLIKPPAPLPTFVGELAPAGLRLPPGVYKERALIEEEIRQRQARWHGVKHVGGHSKKPPPTAH